MSQESSSVPLMKYHAQIQQNYSSQAVSMSSQHVSMLLIQVGRGWGWGLNAIAYKDIFMCASNFGSFQQGPHVGKMARCPYTSGHIVYLDRLKQYHPNPSTSFHCRRPTVIPEYQSEFSKWKMFFLSFYIAIKI